MTKSELRKIYLARQRELSAEAGAKKSRQIADLFFKTLDLTRVSVLHCFIAIERLNEIDTTLIFEKLWKDFSGIETLVPRVNFDMGEIDNLKFTPDTELVQNVWKIHEPSHDEYVKTGEIDMVLVPLVCFDKQGHRVGYGKGFYDKFLSRCRPDCVKIGLSYFRPVEEIADSGPHDISLDAVVTPQKIYRSGREKGE